MIAKLWEDDCRMHNEHTEANFSLLHEIAFSLLNPFGYAGWEVLVR
ncbi:MAG: hypothetical protein WDZ51_03055 [Pirellulaceae bacterium]